jgi:hypothetical protein
MGRHWEKRIVAAREAVAAAGAPLEAPGPMTPEQIESFVKGFGLSAAAVKQVVSRWTGDQARAYSRGYDDAEQAAYQDDQL